MRVYVLVPHEWHVWEDVSFFSSFALVEQTALSGARRRINEGTDPDWCCILAYDGQDELYPIFVYTIVGDRLHRETWAIPSP